MDKLLDSSYKNLLKHKLLLHEVPTLERYNDFLLKKIPNTHRYENFFLHGINILLKNYSYALLLYPSSIRFTNFYKRLHFCCIKTYRFFFPFIYNLIITYFCLFSYIFFKKIKRFIYCHIHYSIRLFLFSSFYTTIAVIRVF